MSPTVCYFYSPDRKGEHPKQHLKGFAGVLHADGYAGFKDLYEPKTPGEPARISEAACMAHVRRKFFDLTVSNPAPIADEALRRIGDLYDIEAGICGSPPDWRRQERQAKTRPRFDALRLWLDAQLSQLPRKSAGRGDPLRHNPVAGSRPLHRRRHDRDRQQCRRAVDPPDCPWAQKLAVCRLGRRWLTRGRHPVADRNCQAQWCRAGGLPVRRAHKDRGSPDQQDQ